MTLLLEKLLEQTGDLLEKVIFMPISTENRKAVIYETLKMLSQEISLRFGKKPVYMNEEFLEKIKVALNAIAVDYQTIDMTYRNGYFFTIIIANLFVITRNSDINHSFYGIYK